MRNNVSVKILQQLFKNSKKSDRELAKSIGISQATFTRRRKQLERKVIREYTIMPDFYELGFEILAFTFLSVKISIREQWKDMIERGRQSIAKYPNVVFASGGEGLGQGSVMVSLHEDYTSYTRFLQEFRREWADILVDVQSFLVSLKGDVVVKPYTLRSLAEILPTIVKKQL